MLGLHRCPGVRSGLHGHRRHRRPGCRPSTGPAGADPCRPRPPRRELPAAPGLRWVAADFHAHTVHSDGELTVPELAALAVAAGLDALAVTDHNTVGHHAELAEVGRRYGVALIPGQEVTTELRARQRFRRHRLGRLPRAGAATGWPRWTRAAGCCRSTIRLPPTARGATRCRPAPARRGVALLLARRRGAARWPGGRRGGRTSPRSAAATGTATTATRRSACRRRGSRSTTDADGPDTRRRRAGRSARGPHRGVGRPGPRPCCCRSAASWWPSARAGALWSGHGSRRAVHADRDTIFPAGDGVRC